MRKKVNYRALLKKYMDLHSQSEGVFMMTAGGEEYTPEEREIIDELIDEIENEYMGMENVLEKVANGCQ